MAANRVSRVMNAVHADRGRMFERRERMRPGCLVISMVVTAVTTTGCARQASIEPIATIEQIMEATVEPVSNAIFDAAVWVNGEQVGGPKTDEDWKLLEADAMMLAETTNLLLMNGRAKDQTGWVTRTQALREAAVETAKAAQARNIDAIFMAGTHIYEACTGCHLQYMPALTAPPRPNTNGASQH
jgi:hypothetical protein